MDDNNPFLNGGFALGGGLGSMPVAAPYSLGGVGLGALLQGGSSGVPGVFGAALGSNLRQNMLNALPFAAAGGAGVGAGAMAMQPKQDETPQQTQPQATNNQYAPFGGDTAPQTEYAPFGGDTAPASPQQQTPDSSGMSEMDMYRMASGALQGMGRNMQMQMPSGNTAQIMRDQNQFRFASTPQQQMANALRRR